MGEKQYRASIKVVGTVLADTKLILKEYLRVKNIEVLKNEVLENNLILKASRRRSETIFYEVRKRYLQDQKEEYIESPFIYFIKKIDLDSTINLILYYYLCKEERVIYEYVCDFVYNKYKQGDLGVSSAETVEFLMELADIDENVSKWSDRTINDVRSGMMGVLKEFGFINSRNKPLFNKVFIPSIIFYYVLYENKKYIKTVDDLYNCKDLKLFLLSNNDINVLIEEAYRNDIIEFKTNDDSKAIIYKYKDIREIIDGYVNGEVY
ncbi:DUF1819 family protein [Terrisporobacter glycolicus]|nr:DUF1819 family protein [Terrisporobacter glycolicus]